MTSTLANAAEHFFEWVESKLISQYTVYIFQTMFGLLSRSSMNYYFRKSLAFIVFFTFH